MPETQSFEMQGFIPDVRDLVSGQVISDFQCSVTDGNGEFTAAIGLEMDGSGFGLGTRSQRYAMVIDDGVVSILNVESGPGLDVSSAETILEQL